MLQRQNTLNFFYKLFLKERNNRRLPVAKTGFRVKIVCMKKGPGFKPDEIIFAVTDRCNLRCKHCFVTRKNIDLTPEDSINFLKSCLGSEISRIGFSGGEPFLNLNFLLEISTFAVGHGLMFDRVMTNGVWWGTEKQLKNSLESLYQTGFDGKIGISWDSFHNQSPEQIGKFCTTAFEIWGDGTVIEIQSVIPEERHGNHLTDNFRKLAEILGCKTKTFLNTRSGEGSVILENTTVYIKADCTPLCYKPEDPRSWRAKHWFRENYCRNSGQLLYVHPDGTIAPCCGTGNENPSLKIGSIKQTLREILKQAEANEFVQICFKTGLLSEVRREAKKSNIFPGKTQDPCAACSLFCNFREQRFPCHQ